MHIAHGKTGTFLSNGEIDFGSHFYQLGIHIGAVIVRDGAVDLAGLGRNAHHADHGSERDLDGIGEVGKAIMHGDDFGVGLCNAVAKNAQTTVGDHDAVVSKVDGHDLYAQCVAGVSTVDVNGAYGAVHNADVDIRALYGGVRDLAGVTVIGFYPEHLSVFHGVVGGICGVEVENNFVFRNDSHGITDPLLNLTSRQAGCRAWSRRSRRRPERR